MKIPRNFKHKGKTWKVVYCDVVKVEGEVVNGSCDFDKRTICLERGLKGQKKTNVFFHELFHVVIYEAHIINGVRFSEGLEEVMCDSFSDLLATSFDLKWKKSK